MKFKIGDTLVFDGKEINIKMQIGLKKGSKAVVRGEHKYGLLMESEKGYNFGLYFSQIKHFKLHKEEI